MDIKLRRPEEGDYRPLEGSAGEAYGCRTFIAGLRVSENTTGYNPPPTGFLVTGSREEVSGLISENTTWSADLIRITGSVEVAPDVSLTISPGTRVEFAGFFRLLVRGRLWAVGEPNQRIRFTATAELQDKGWDGIDFLNIPAANGFSRLEHCNLSFAVAESEKNGTARPQTGGAVSIVGVNQLIIASCIFENNRADYGAAVYCGYGSSPVLAGNLFHHNTAVWNGSAIFNVYAYPKLINNTIVHNNCLSESEFHLCGAVENFNGKIPLINNIIRDNFTNHYSGAQLVENKDYDTLANNIEGYAGNGTNMDSDPRFVDEGASPYQLMEDSACIDAGVDHTLAGALTDNDIIGNDRICAVGIDMGAFESCGMISSVSPEPQRRSLTCVPNPFNPNTRIIYDLPHDGPVKLLVYDLQGRLLQTLVDSPQIAGRYEVSWNGSDGNNRPLASGTYLYRLQTGSKIETRSMTLVR